jgi:hexosaminidase
MLRFSLLAGVVAVCVQALCGEPTVNVIPRPEKMELLDGTPFALRDGVRVRLVGDAPASLADRAIEAVHTLTGVSLKSADGAAGAGEVTLRFDPTVGKGRPDWQAQESYRLAVARDGSSAEVAASAAHGLCNGIQTFAQLAQQHDDKQWRVRPTMIEDSPRFPWRGLMLDCSRTFQSVEYLKKTLDRMALYKLNVLHLHLTDDQGWRLEIKKRPELTQKGARFPDKFKEPESTQGFYSQDQMRELIAYAAQRHIVIVPEIEMPGHELAALACYPQLSCTGGPFEIFPFFKGPNITADIFCAGNEETFRFIEDVLGEVVELFPSRYVHLGGDEVPKARWKKCPRCQERLRAEGLKNEEELQSYFMRRAAGFLAGKGRRAIGWDEILEGGLPADTAVMSWRGMAGGTAAAKADHDVVMSPTSHCYFDYDYKAINSQRAYAFEPLPPALSADQARHILGLQANFWSHIDRAPDRVDRQLFPRLLALAERAWSPADCRDWGDFRTRLNANKPRLKLLGIAFNDQDGN